MGGDYPPIENKLSTCGMFSLPGSIHAGDHYVKDKPEVMSRYKGKQMVVPGAVWGKNQDAMIDKEFKRLSENDVYMDPGAAERKARLANKKHVSDKAFLPSSPMKTTTGKGTHVGCFGKYEYVERPQPERREKSGPGPKNFLPSKPVKGTYGMTGHFLAPPLEFIADPFLNSRVFEKEDKRAAREKIVKPFMSTGRSTGLFDKTIHQDDPGPTYRQKLKADLPQFKAFRAPGPCKTGANCTFSYPEHIDDSEVERYAAQKAARLAAQPKGPGFKLSAGAGHSWYTTDVNPYATPARVKPDVEILN